jgi:signal transduction histidine kinase
MKKYECICDFFESDPKHDYLQKVTDGRLWIHYVLEHTEKQHKVKMKNSVFTVNVTELPAKEGRYIAVFGDITELEAYQTSLEEKIEKEREKRRINEQILIEQSKVAAMGEVMTSIAHHWRQPLNIIALQIQDALEVYEMGEMTPEYLRENKERIMHELGYLTHTIDDFRNYFSKDDEAHPFNIKDVINHAISLVWARAEEGKTDISFTEKDITIEGRENEFKQVILNLLFNAVESIGKRQETDEGLHGKIDIVAEETDSCLQITIRDNGTGIDEAIKERIFEPYFTTKFQSRGTGNGLYMSKIIIEHNMNGQLLARNVCDTQNRNCGAEFVITFDN